MTWSLKHAAEIARCDLAFAIGLIKEDVFADRIAHSIMMLTTALDDKDDFDKTLARWKQESSINPERYPRDLAAVIGKQYRISK